MNIFSFSISVLMTCINVFSDALTVLPVLIVN